MPGLQLTYDAGNAACGEDPVSSFEQCASYVVHAHFKDWDVLDQEAEGYRRMLDGRWRQPALIGEGAMDHRVVLRAMQRAGYDGCINIEYEGDAYDPYTATRKAVEYLRSIE